MRCQFKVEACGWQTSFDGEQEEILGHWIKMSLLELKLVQIRNLFKFNITNNKNLVQIEY